MSTISAEQLHAQVSGSSFYAGMRVLPQAEREAMYAIYGFCRIVDDIADDLEGTIEARRSEMDGWRRDVAALYRGEPAGRAEILVQPIRQFGIEQADFVAVIDGMQMDLDREIRWPAYAELDLYCDRVASAVGRLSCPVFGMERETGIELSHHLGRALQLTNILRDIDEDAAIGRVYLPLEALETARIKPTTPSALAADPRLEVAAHWLAARAQQHFAAAHAILARRPKGHLIAPRLMDAAYSRVLAKMLRRGWEPPRRRVRVSKLRLMLTLARHLLLR